MIGPRMVGLEITHFCALRCSFCESHSPLMKAPIIHRRGYAGDRKTMDVDTIRRLARSMAKLNVQWVELSGKGDPIVHPKLAEIIRVIKDEGIQVSMFTTGSVPRAGLGTAVAAAGIDRLNLSLNAATREVWAKVSSKDMWETTLGFLKEVLAARNVHPRRLPWVRVSFVVCKDNVADMDRSVDLIGELRPDEGSWCVMGELKETQSLLLDRDEIERLRAAVPAWKAKLEARGIHHDLDAFGEDLVLRAKAHGTTEPQKNPLQEGLPCYEGWSHTVIGPDGAVAPCCFCEKVDLGNVVDQDFVQIWNGDRYADFRERSMEMAKGGPSICWECHTTCNKAHENLAQHQRRKAFGLTR